MKLHTLYTLFYVLILKEKYFNNEINVNDIPDAWNEEYKRLFDKKVE